MLCKRCHLLQTHPEAKHCPRCGEFDPTDAIKSDSVIAIAWGILIYAVLFILGVGVGQLMRLKLGN
jgi:uncharacterized paraquat-inducible protein A